MCPLDALRHAPKPDKREAILDAAVALFAERGFHGTAVPLVAKRAHVGTGTIYRYFDSKEALVNAAYQHWKRHLAQVLLDDLAVDLAPRARFRQIFHKIVDFALENPEAVAFMELHHHTPYLDDASRDAENRLLGPIYAFVSSAQEAELVKPVAAPVLVALVWGAIVGLIREAWRGRFELTPKVLEDAEACAWEAIRL